MWCNILIECTANLISGFVLAFIFFILSDHLFKIPNLSGHWIFEAKTLKTTYNKYQNLILTYKILIWIEGRNVYGTGEKIKEQIGDIIKEYTGQERTRIKISGYIKKAYLGRDKIIIHYDEKGELRESSTIHLLTKKGNGLAGTFISTIADSEGLVRWSKQLLKF